MIRFKLIKFKYEDCVGLRGFLAETVGENCASIDDGEKILYLIRPELTKGFSMEIDFKGLKFVLTSFLSSYFDRLLEQFDGEIIMTRVNMRNISGEFIQRINNFINKKGSGVYSNAR